MVSPLSFMRYQSHPQIPSCDPLADPGSPLMLANWMQQSQLSQPCAHYALAQERGCIFSNGPNRKLTDSHWISYHPSQCKQENGMRFTDESPKTSTYFFSRDSGKGRSSKVRGIDLRQMSSTTQHIQ